MDTDMQSETMAISKKVQSSLRCTLSDYNDAYCDVKVYEHQNQDYPLVHVRYPECPSATQSINHDVQFGNVVCDDRFHASFSLSHPNSRESLDAADKHEIFEIVKQRLEIVLRQYISAEASELFYPEGMLWVGKSLVVRSVERACLKFAGVDFPVLLRGEKGTGKIAAASSIHFLSHRATKPFIDFNCLAARKGELWAELNDVYQQALGGTLFLRNLNALDNLTLAKLSHLWEREYIGTPPPVRIVASVCSQYDCLALTESSAPWLPLSLPSLQERQADVVPLLESFINKYATIRPVRLTAECRERLIKHSFHDNGKGLERAIALLSVLANEEEVCLDTLVDVLPELEDPNVKIEAKCEGECSLVDSSETSEGSNAPDTQRLVGVILDHKEEQLKLPHPALLRAVVLLAEEYGNKITLEYVANAVFVSPAHLSFLFRKHLGISFKQLLLQVRIEKSKRLLTAPNPMQVTQISHEVGFHDLSHFEKTFRKLVGLPPLQFRSQAVH